MKILLADDHAMMRDGLRAILSKEMDVEVVAEASNGRDAVELARRLHPNVVVMDVGMARLNGIDATREIVASNREIKVIGLSMNSDHRYVVAMFAAGAVGYLVKDSASSELLLALRAVMQNQTYLSPTVAEAIVSRVRTSPAERSSKALSTREREVLQLLAEGQTSKDIAAALGLALPTVETHRRQIVTKLGLRSIAELTKYAIREGLTVLEK